MQSMNANNEAIRDELVALSHWLGEPARDLAIIGEGNTSARLPDGTFWIKASGSNLGSLAPEQLVQVRRDTIVNALSANLDDLQVKQALMDARVNADAPRPSIETFFHALMYELTDANFVGHTHPIAICSVICSQRAEDITRHIMPDVIIVCGLHGVFVPYIDVGATLANEIGNRVREFIRRHDMMPKVIYLQNHGFIALGQTAREVQNITAMAVKNARVLAATYAMGGPVYLDEFTLNRIHTRPDEDVRRVQFK
jgi:rhamnose utilization protein RhaD (predicted bifunctional aldolase and dehydrogenase)